MPPSKPSLAVALALMLAAPSAQAEDEAEAGRARRAPARTILAEPAIGIGAPLGWIGLSAVLVPIESLAFHGGVGFGSQGPQISVGVRGRIPLRANEHVSVGGGWSSGEVAVVGSSALPGISQRRYSVWLWDRAQMVDFDLSLEHDSRSFFVARPFVGLGYILNGEDAIRVNEPAPCHCTAGVLAKLIPYAGVAFALGVL